MSGMPFQFPTSPYHNQVVTGPGGIQYRWDGEKWVAVGGGGDGGDFLPISGGMLTAPGNITTPGAFASATSTNVARMAMLPGFDDFELRITDSADTWLTGFDFHAMGGSAAGGGGHLDLHADLIADGTGTFINGHLYNDPADPSWVFRNAEYMAKLVLWNGGDDFALELRDLGGTHLAGFDWHATGGSGGKGRADIHNDIVMGLDLRVEGTITSTGSGVSQRSDAPSWIFTTPTLVATMLSWPGYDNFALELRDPGGTYLAGFDYHATGGSGGKGRLDIHNDVVMDINLRIEGDLNVVGTITPSPSDLRLKEAVELYTPGLKAVRALNPISWEWNGKGGKRRDGHRYAGIAADEAEELLPYAVGTRPPSSDDNGVGYKTLDYQPVVAALVNAVKKLAAEVEILKKVR